MNRPILLDYALDRSGNDKKIFQYDYSHDMNVLKKNTAKLYIEAGNSFSTTETETRVRRESDDSEYAFIELATKTEAARERDDEDDGLLELFTKTSVNRERDDEDDFYLNK
jgi:hypothetical protein